MVTGEIIVEDVPWSVFQRDTLNTLIDAQRGVIARWQALRFLTQKAIRHRVESGRWRRVHRTICATYGGPVTVEQRHWIAVLAASSSSVMDTEPACLAGLSALQVHGLRTITSSRIHVLIPATRRVVAAAGVVLHRSRQFTADDRHPATMPPALSALSTTKSPAMIPPTTTIGRAVVDAAAWARSDDEARLVIAASFQQRLVTASEIIPVLNRLQNVPRRRLIVMTVNDASAGSHTLGELALVAICRKARLPLPTRQMRIRDLAGRVRFLDAVFDPWKVAVEIDGAHHNDVAQRWDDDARDNALILAAYTILRYPSHVVREQPGQVAAQLRTALMRAGWRP